jgi:hypothetical protein
VDIFYSHEGEEWGAVLETKVKAIIEDEKILKHPGLRYDEGPTSSNTEGVIGSNALRLFRLSDFIR